MAPIVITAKIENEAAGAPASAVVAMAKPNVIRASAALMAKRPGSAKCALSSRGQSRSSGVSYIGRAIITVPATSRIAAVMQRSIERSLASRVKRR